jgi:hypothetical protein
LLNAIVVLFPAGELETLQKETDAARREFAARYAFSLLDTDMDGYVRTDQVQLFDVFQVGEAAMFKH